MTSVTVTWPGASDNVGVVAYRIFWGARCCTNGTLAAEVPSTIHSYSMTGMSPGVNYIVWIEAGDAAGNWAVGANAGVTTPTWWQQYWYLLAAAVVSSAVAVVIIDARRQQKKTKRPAIIRPSELERLTN